MRHTTLTQMTDYVIDYHSQLVLIVFTFYMTLCFQPVSLSSCYFGGIQHCVFKAGTTASEHPLPVATSIFAPYAPLELSFRCDDSGKMNFGTVDCHSEEPVQPEMP